MEWVNITAKSLPEAIDLALDNLGVDEAEAEIEVLEEPRQGLFGRTRGNARVRARVKPKATRPKVERGRGRRRRSEGGGSNERGSGGGSRNRGRSEGRNRSEGGGRDGSKSKGQSTNRNRSGAKNNERRDRDDQRARPAKRERDETPVEEASMEEVSAHVESFLSGLTEAFGFDGSVSINPDGDNGIVGMVDGRHGLMVGPKGRTLDAIQELTRVSAQRAAPSNVRIKVDVGGYREVRREALTRFALEAADEARRDGMERSLEPMSSADRKVVHDALNGLTDIETRSAGSEPNRRVVVVPLGSDDDDAGEDDSDEGADDSAPIGEAEDVIDTDTEDVAESADSDDVDDVDETDTDTDVDESEAVGS